jgi:hypothetical protein
MKTKKAQKGYTASHRRSLQVGVLRFGGMSDRDIARRLKVPYNRLRQDIGLPKLPAAPRKRGSVKLRNPKSIN